MNEIIDFLTEFNAVTVVIRVVLAAVAGALVGLEREFHGRAAGMRTHMMVALGAALAAMIGLFTVKELGVSSDPMRVGAQVISGVGFLGAGTILLRGGGSRITGLTTAAGLWTAAIVGLCCGAAYFEGAIITTLVVILAELVLARLEYFIVSNARAFNLYVEYSESGNLGGIVDTIKKNGGYIIDLEITKNAKEGRNPCAVFSLQTPRKISHQTLMAKIANLDGVVSVEEL